MVNRHYYLAVKLVSVQGYSTAQKRIPSGSCCLHAQCETRDFSNKSVSLIRHWQGTTEQHAQPCAPFLADFRQGAMCFIAPYQSTAENTDLTPLAVDVVEDDMLWAWQHRVSIHGGRRHIKQRELQVRREHGWLLHEVLGGGRRVVVAA